MTACVAAFFDSLTGTISYVVSEQQRTPCAIVDSLLDYDPQSRRISTASADRIYRYVVEQGLYVEWILETHAHADHLSAASYLRERLGGKIAIGAGIGTVQKAFAGVLELGSDFPTDGSQFDQLFRDGDEFYIGRLKARVIAVPGHTPADLAYAISDCIFVGDTLFMPDVGTARCDFPGGDATQLYRSIRRLLNGDADTTLYMCHDYPPNGRAPRWSSTVGEQRRENIHIREGISEQEFVIMRVARDATLDSPGLLLPAMEVNIRGGRIAQLDSTGGSNRLLAD